MDPPDAAPTLPEDEHYVLLCAEEGDSDGAGFGSTRDDDSDVDEEGLEWNGRTDELHGEKRRFDGGARTEEVELGEEGEAHVDLSELALKALESEYSQVVSLPSIHELADQVEAVLAKARAIEGQGTGGAEKVKEADQAQPRFPEDEALSLEQIARVRKTVLEIGVSTPGWATGLESSEDLVAKLSNLSSSSLRGSSMTLEKCNEKKS